MAQIHGKQLRDDSILLAKLDNAGSQGTVLFGAGSMIGITDAPSAGTDIANKDYVDSLAAGLDPKESVRIATRTDISGTYNSTGGTGGTGEFTAVDLTSDTLFDLNGGSTTVSIGDRILIKNQSTQTQNGIYVVTTAGATGVIERAEDHDGSPAGEVSSGNYTFVETGDTEVNKGYVLQGDGLLALNTDNLVWVQFSQASALSAGDGIDISSNTVSVDLATTSGLAFSTGQLLVDSSDGITLDANGVAINLTANGGLEFTGTAGSGTLNIAGDTVSANTIAINTTANGAGIQYDATAGLTETSDVLEVNLAATGGLEFSGGAIQINGDATTANTIAITTTANGAGIVYDPTAGLTENSDQLQVALLGTGGLGFTLGQIAVIGDNVTGATVAPVTVGTNGVGVTVDNSTITHTGGTISVNTTGLSLTSSNISDFDEAAQDAVGNIFVDSATIDFTYSDGTPSITAIVIDNSIDENKLTASVAGTGLSGGAGTALSVDYSTAGASGAAIEASALASTANGEGASMIGIEDVAGNFTATDVEAALAELFDAIASGGVPVTDNKEMTASVTTADGDAATATTIVGTPASDSYVQVFINGVKVILGDGVTTKDCYFSADGGTTPKSIAAIAAGDTLYWNGSVAGYELDGNDRVDFDYVV
jgi:hypothetical protein